MKIRVRYRNGRLQVVQQEERDDFYDDLELFDAHRVDWLSVGVDPIRSMIRGPYEAVTQRKQYKK